MQKNLQIFLSYAHDDHALKEQVEAFLKEAGYAVWSDKYIPGSEEWREYIDGQLAESNGMVVIVTKASMRSYYVTLRECFKTHERAKRRAMR
ncbi:MAG: toll/interleukin-1 receptor domain-containing protein [Chloroflexi bacterium]|nr:toll/interleukin-1 receptor domain-containing protein [Chloroflexota bacterium]